MKKSSRNQGFTLLELLIVIAIIAILSVVLVLVLDPAETLKKSRDAQRMSDLATIKVALGLYTTSTSSPIFAGTSNAACKGATWTTTTDKIYYSLPKESLITDVSLDGVVSFSANFGATQASSTSIGLTDGTGWLPVNLSSLVGGSPISNFPIDPSNTVTDLGNVAAADLVYRYGCSDTGRYEINARLESNAFTVADNRMTKDGGNNSNLYEVGTDLTIFGTTSDF